MPYTATHRSEAPTREQIDALDGLAVLEFGTGWCGHCQRAQPLIEQLLGPRDDVAHIKIEDGPGRPLGRSFGVKLWPTLVFLRQGREVARLVRPADAAAFAPAMQALDSAPAAG